MASNRIFKSVDSQKPAGRTVFDLSYSKVFDCDMGELIPVCCDEVLPGDKWKISNQVVVRFQPLVAPILHEVMIYTHYFFVPYRLLWDKWEDFITGGKLGNDASIFPSKSVPSGGFPDFSLADYFGFPTKVAHSTSDYGTPISQMPWRAYDLVYNEFYRDETLQDEVVLGSHDDVLHRCWQKDYFTSALPFLQRGVAPSVLVRVKGVFSFKSTGPFTSDVPVFHSAASGSGLVSLGYDSTTNHYTDRLIGSTSAGESKLDEVLNDMLDTEIVGFDINSLREAYAIQRSLEANARGGIRYTEWLQMAFGVHNRDSRLQRPEYVGGTKGSVLFSEVLQTSSTDSTSPQGNLAGHGIAVSRSQVSSYYATEHGIMLGLMSIMPLPSYQQGVNRQWLRRVKEDFYRTEFAHLSEQPITMAEIYLQDGDVKNSEVFGYQGRWDEYRTKQDQVCGSMRDSLKFWHLGRTFANKPLLNEEFVKCVPRKDIFAAEKIPGLIVHYSNLIQATRSLPYVSKPAL